MLDNFKTYLEKHNISPQDIKKRLSIVKEFAGFLNGRHIDINRVDVKTLYDYSAVLIEGEQNFLLTYEVLRDYAGFIGNRVMYVTFIEITDGWNVMEVLAKEIEKRWGREIKNRVFKDGLPTLGITETERSQFTAAVMERMLQNIPGDKARHLWFSIQHGLQDAVFNDEDDRELYLNSSCLDDFFLKKKEKLDNWVTELKNTNQLWYTLEINDQVLDFIKDNQEIEVGKREGNAVFITKIPYNPVKYINEEDDTLKRYYACHCPWVREAIISGREISPEICNCSAGHASHYISGALNKKIKGKVLESALQGDLRCRFVFELPENVN